MIVIVGHPKLSENDHIASDVLMLSKAARMYDEDPIPAKPAPTETSTESNNSPSSHTAAFPPNDNHVVVNGSPYED